MLNDKKSPALDYSRRVFDSALEWYKNADSKAQIILTIDGAFLAFLTSSVFMEQDKLSKILSKFGLETWLLLALMCLALAASILSAIICLRSRIYSEEGLDEILRTANVDAEKSETYRPEHMFFFQFMSRLGERQLAEKLSAVDEKFEVEVLAHEIPILSKNVMEKHRWVNRGFALAGASLILFLGVAISYVARVNS